MLQEVLVRLSVRVGQLVDIFLFSTVSYYFFSCNLDFYLDLDVTIWLLVLWFQTFGAYNKFLFFPRFGKCVE